MRDAVCDVVEWIRGRYTKEWQRDALRRVVQQSMLTDADVQELAAMVRASAGRETKTVPQPRDLDTSGGGSDSQATNPTVTLARMHSLKDVNALASDQAISFAFEGVTVIYGENGAGKTGYSRVLRRACRQWREKDVKEIRPNIHSDSPGIPEAKFDVIVGGQNETVVWRQGSKAPAQLAGFAVFDSQCVPAIVGEENAVTYQPESLRIMPRFADLVTKVAGIISVEVRVLRTVPEALRSVPRGGRVDAFLSDLSPDSDLSEIDRIVGDPEAAANRLTEVINDIAQAASKDGPEAQARAREALRDRCERLRLQVQQFISSVDDAARDALRATIADVALKREAAELASKERFDDGYLPGTGGSAWRVLFDAAKAFSLEALREEPFPPSGEAARCPWCQQTLEVDARRRIQRFAAFVEDCTAQQLQAAESALATRLRSLKTGPLPVVDPDLLEAIRARRSLTAEALVRLPERIGSRRAALVETVESGGWDTIPRHEDAGIVAELLEIERLLDQEAAERRATVDPRRQAALAAERQDLEVRLGLHGARDQVSAFVVSFRAARSLEQALGSCEMRQLSIENAKRSQLQLTQTLAEALRMELRLLGADKRIRVELKARGERGQTLNQLVLAGTSIAKSAVLNVLSEGEQRVLAVATFLAELSLASDKVGVIFDDPVTSLDHRWSEQFARRIVDFAADRQVIIFTHDIAFFMALHDEAAEQQVPFHSVFVARLGDVPGHCTGQPWETMDLKKRLIYIEALLPELDSLFQAEPSGPNYSRTVGAAFDLLRSCWERAVEEELLAEVVVRFRSSIETKRLKEVVVDEDAFKRVSDGMTRTSRSTPAHDRAARRTPERRCPDDVREELTHLREFTKSVKAKQSTAVKMRVSLTKPPVATLAN